MKKVFITAILPLLCGFTTAAQKPKLVVNIVISQMRNDYLQRFGENFGEDGFGRFEREGAVFTDCLYGYALSTTTAGLGTITTGANPSIAGTTSPRWVDYTVNGMVSLAGDNTVRGLDCDYGIGEYSPKNIVVPTLGDKLLDDNPESRVYTIASDPLSAVVTGGQTGNVYWLDQTRATWISSTAYMDELPSWVKAYNSVRTGDKYLNYNWQLFRDRTLYRNRDYTVVNLQESAPSRFRRLLFAFENFFRRRSVSNGYPQIFSTPAGNSLVMDFARWTIEREELGAGGHTDMINICFDTPRYVGELFGPGSVEVEDMYYRLDTELAQFMNFLFGRFAQEEVLVMLTSDHGTSDAFNIGGAQRDRFNSDQFKVIVNGFMNAQYGTGEWVVDFIDRQLYLNHNLMFTQGLSIEEVQNRVATFVLQFRGVSHVLTSTALSSSYFGGSYAQKMQNSFYPKRSGDLMINLMPGWITESEGICSESGSMYDYDTHVPLMFIGSGLEKGRYTDRVDPVSIAPTLARIMEIGRPIASEGAPILQIVSQYEQR